MTDEQFAAVLEGITKALQGVTQGQEAIVKTLASLEKSQGLKIDPSKLVASTNGIVSGLKVVEPLDPTKPNLEEPVLTHPFTGQPVQKVCYKCNQIFSGSALHCR